MTTLHRTWCDFFGLPDQLSLSIHPNPGTGLAEPATSVVYGRAEGTVTSDVMFAEWFKPVAWRAPTIHQRLCEFVADMYNASYLVDYLKEHINIFRIGRPAAYRARLREAQLWFPVPEPSEFPLLTFTGAMVMRTARASRGDGSVAATHVASHDDFVSVAQYRTNEGLCPKCGEKGRYSNCVPVCSTHGSY